MVTDQVSIVKAVNKATEGVQQGTKVALNRAVIMATAKAVTAKVDTEAALATVITVTDLAANKVTDRAVTEEENNNDTAVIQARAVMAKITVQAVTDRLAIVQVAIKAVTAVTTEVHKATNHPLLVKLASALVLAVHPASLAITASSQQTVSTTEDRPTTVHTGCLTKAINHPPTKTVNINKTKKTTAYSFAGQPNDVFHTPKSNNLKKMPNHQPPNRQHHKFHMKQPRRKTNTKTPKNPTLTQKPTTKKKTKHFSQFLSGVNETKKSSTTN